MIVAFALTVFISQGGRLFMIPCFCLSAHSYALFLLVMQGVTWPVYLHTRLFGSIHLLAIGLEGSTWCT
jgi:hypothetical protein